ncbi:hypothetical protein HN873_070040 [Arachis hypogaea]
MLLFKHKGNSDFQVRIFDFGGRENTYQPRPLEEPLYKEKGTYQRARCLNNPSSDKAKPNVPHLSHFTGQRHTLILSHRHIEVESTYTRFSGRQDGSFGVIFGGWAHFASLCKFEPGGVEIFEVMSTEPVTILQESKPITTIQPKFNNFPIPKQFLLLHAGLVSSSPPSLPLSITIVFRTSSLKHRFARSRPHNFAVSSKRLCPVSQYLQRSLGSVAALY